MTIRAHLELLLVGTGAWVVFWVAGLPAYYQQYSITFMVCFDALLALILLPVFWRWLTRARRERRLEFSLWMAFYFTVPLALYDWLYCGVFLGHGLGFVTRYWYVSVYYVIPWLMLPACALALGRRAGRARSPR